MTPSISFDKQNLTFFDHPKKCSIRFPSQVLISFLDQTNGDNSEEEAEVHHQFPMEDMDYDNFPLCSTEFDRVNDKGNGDTTLGAEFESYDFNDSPGDDNYSFNKNANMSNNRQEMCYQQTSSQNSFQIKKLSSNCTLVSKHNEESPGYCDYSRPHNDPHSFNKPHNDPHPFNKPHNDPHSFNKPSKPIPNRKYSCKTSKVIEKDLLNWEDTSQDKQEIDDLPVAPVYSAISNGSSLMKRNGAEVGMKAKSYFVEKQQPEVRFSNNVMNQDPSPRYSKQRMPVQKEQEEQKSLVNKEFNKPFSVQAKNSLNLPGRDNGQFMKGYGSNKATQRDFSYPANPLHNDDESSSNPFIRDSQKRSFPVKLGGKVNPSVANFMAAHEKTVNRQTKEAFDPFFPDTQSLAQKAKNQEVYFSPKPTPKNCNGEKSFVLPSTCADSGKSNTNVVNLEDEFAQPNDSYFPNMGQKKASIIDSPPPINSQMLGTQCSSIPSSIPVRFSMLDDDDLNSSVTEANNSDKKFSSVNM